MDQAGHSPTTSRRKFLAGAAAVLGAPTVVIVSADAALFALESRITEIGARLDVAARALTRAENAMRGWRRHNPRPELVSTKKDMSGDDFKSFFAERADWDRRRKIAEENCGLAEAEAHHAAILDEHTEACRRLCAMSATTLDGLKCKARVWDTKVFPELTCSLAEDLLAMQAVHS